MSGSLGLIEVILVFAGVLGWGFYELRSVRRAKHKAEKTRQDEDLR